MDKKEKKIEDLTCIMKATKWVNYTFNNLHTKKNVDQKEKVWGLTLHIVKARKLINYTLSFIL